MPDLCGEWWGTGVCMECQTVGPGEVVTSVCLETADWATQGRPGWTSPAEAAGIKSSNQVDSGCFAADQSDKYLYPVPELTPVCFLPLQAWQAAWEPYHLQLSEVQNESPVIESAAALVHACSFPGCGNVSLHAPAASEICFAISLTVYRPPGHGI